MPLSSPLCPRNPQFSRVPGFSHSPLRFSLILFLGIAVLSPLSRAAAGESKPVEIGFLGIWDRAAPLLERASRETGIPNKVFRIADITGAEDTVAVLNGIRVLYVLNFAPDEAEKLKTTLLSLKEKCPDLRVIAVDRRDAHATLANVGLMQEDGMPPRYWRANGLSNMRRLLHYTAIKYLNAPGEIEQPVMVPDYGYYLPGVDDAFSDLPAFRTAAKWIDGAPVAALLIQQSFWITEDTQVINAEITALRKHSFNVVTLFGDSAARVCAMLREVKPDIIVEDRHGSFWEGEDKKPLLEELDVPYLRPISMLASTVEEWQQSPRGLLPRDISHFMTLQEMKGTLDPIVIGGLKHSVQGFRLHIPIPDRIERFAERAAAWHNLRAKPNAEKKIAILYYNKGIGKWDCMRGSPTGAFLDGPASMMRFLPRMKEAGYGLTDVPTDAEALMKDVVDHGCNVGPWAQGQLEELADKPSSVLIPLSRYNRWFMTKLSKENREKVISFFGQPPGKLMVVTRNKEPQIVIPTIPMGNAILAPEPVRGEREDNSLLHSRDVPPPHNFLAFYWWLQEEYKADAVVNWGTHGSLFLLPGKETGMSSECWSDICIGALPAINPWIMDNLGEASLCRRRSYVELVDHMVPAAVSAGLTDDLREIEENILKFDTLETGVLKEEFRKRINESILATGVAKTLALAVSAEALATDQDIRRVGDYLDDVKHTTTPTCLHILGTPPDAERLPDYLVSILGRDFLTRCGDADIPTLPPADPKAPPTATTEKERLREKARTAVRRYVIGNEAAPEVLAKDVEFGKDMLARLNRADDEIKNLLHGLAGCYVPPGPGPDPIRNAGSIPAGRNLYCLNPEEIPTRASWEVAKQLVDEMLKMKTPQKVGIDLNGMNTMRDFGVMEGQILYLIGAKPVWDANGLVTDIEIIPLQELGRPRVDVFIAMGGMYKENFPTRVKLLDKAIRMISELAEEGNSIRAGTETMHASLLAKGYAEDRADLLAPARIFGTKPGNYGTNILFLVPRTGVWDKPEEIGDVYIDNMNHVFTGDLWGEKADDVYREAIQGTDTLIRIWASNMTSQLSNHHAYEYLGGLSMAVKAVTGKDADAFIADVRDPSGAKMRTFEEVLETTLRTELLNRKWIEGMMQNDYAGAGHINEMVTNTLGWDVTRDGSVDDRTWSEIYDTYVKDKYNLKLTAWFKKVNPYACQELTATLLEASRKGYWKASEEQVETLSRQLAQLVVEHGLSAGMSFGGNRELGKYIRAHLNAPGDAALKEAHRQVVAKAVGASAETDKAKTEEKVHGPQMEKVYSEATIDPEAQPWTVYAAAAFFLLLAAGFWRRMGGLS